MSTPSGWNQQPGQHPPHGGGWSPPPQGWGQQPPGPPPPAPPKRKKWPFIVIPLAIVFALAAVRAIYVFVLDDDSDSIAVPTTTPTFEMPPTSETSAAPPAPGAPIPCEPESPAYGLCFPPEYDINAVKDSVAGAGWSCLVEGQRDEIGSPVSDPWMCETVRQTGKYGIYTKISPETHNYDLSGKLKTFSIDVNTVAAFSRGESATAETPTPHLFEAFDALAGHIWVGKPDKLQEATAAFNQLKPQCDSPAGRTMDGVSIVTPSGYQLSCTSTGFGAGTTESVSYGQTITIEPAD